ncbi:MAG: allantoicase [Streptosporangiaceae bacterium]
MAEDFLGWVDLASRRLGGSVVYANDELFAEKENLIKPGPPVFAEGDFGNKGKIYDGWETRRRRQPGHDHAVIRLGCAGVVHGVVVDTAFFRGNYPPEISVEATNVTGYPSPAELAHATWHPLVPKAAAKGDSANSYQVDDPRRWTHVRLSIYPDGGVARLRVHGEVVPDPAFMTGTVDLAAMENGGRVVGCSDAFYSSPSNLIQPGLARVMGDGWENARRRGPGNDFVVFRLAAAGRLRHVQIDTSYFVGNAPGWIELSGASGTDDGALTWRPVLARTPVQPDTKHRFLIEEQAEATHLRLDVFPDGGLARFRAYGEIAGDASAALAARWLDTTP